MRVLVCGSRHFADLPFVYRALSQLHAERPISTIIEGGATGADRLARNWAIANAVDFETYDANWNRYGKAAGPIRNREMLKRGKPDAIVAFPGNTGTADMLNAAIDAGVEVIDPKPLLLRAVSPEAPHA